MHIVQMINALRVGGAEKLVVTFARSVQTKNAQLTVITLRTSVPEVKQMVLDTGARVVEFHHRKMFAPGRFVQLLQFLKQEKIDVIHTHLTMANILGASSGSLAGIPVVTTLHNVSTESASHPVRGPLESWLLNHNVARLIAVGQETAATQRSRFTDKEITVLPNAVEIPETIPTSRLAALRDELGIPHGAPFLLAVGRLEVQKGMSDLISAFELLLNSQPCAHLAVAGIGSLRDQLVHEIKVAGLEGKVQLLGSRNDIPELLAACDVFVSAAHWEGLPVSILEAMAAGKPVVATQVGDLPQLIKSETGMLVPPGNPPVLADALRIMLSDPQQAASCGIAARQMIVDEYNASDWVDSLLALYADVIQQAARMKKRP